MTKRRPAERKATSKSALLGNRPFAGLATVTATATATVTATAPATGTAIATAPFPGKLVVQREKKGRGGKTVTRIRGVAPGSVDALATQMKKALGCGATVEGGDLLLLGSLVERAAAWLRAQGAERVVEGN